MIRLDDLQNANPLFHSTQATSMKLIWSIALLLISSFNSATFCAGSDDEQFVFTGFTGSNLVLDGAARITSTGVVELTNDTARIKGHAIYPSPLRFRQSANGTVQSFSLSFVFGILFSVDDERGHGFAFFIRQSSDFSAAFPIQFLGLFNSSNNGSSTNHIFAVELDTILNTEFGDINDNHVGIDVNSLNSLKSNAAGYYDDTSGVFTNLQLIGSGPIQTWVEYDADTTQINVTLAPLGRRKPVRPLLSSTYNLSTVIEEERAYLGFSSSTGLTTGHHSILGWSFGMNRPAPIIDSAKLPKLPYLGPRPKSKLLEILLPVASALLVLVTGSIIVVLVRRHLRYREVREGWEIEYNPHRFTYKDLFHATKGFSNKQLIGVGGFGKVYKGKLPTSKLEVAVKKVPYNSKQGLRQFIAEIVSIGHLQHRNVVKLLGYCRRKGEFLLVYEFMVNGSLDKLLYGEVNSTLGWGQRFQIIKDVASGLLYLHEEWDQVVIHRDVKPSNVLIDREMNGRLGDFGLARLYDHGSNPQTTHVVGTIGYLAPELVHRGKATTLTDVFAFGIFILEVICGKKPISEGAQVYQIMLADWVLQNWHKGSLLDTMDSRLHDDYNVEEACLALKLGLLCSHRFPQARPNMRQVLQYLDGDVPLPELLPAQFSFQNLALVQNEGQVGFSTVSLYSPPPMMTSFGSISRSCSLEGRK